MSSRLHSRFGALGLRAALIAAGFGAFSTSGCLSHEYRIPKDELTRVAQLEPGARGQRVRVLQQLGQRRGEPVPPRAPPAPFVGPPLPYYPPPPLGGEPEPEVYVDFHAGFDVPLHHAGAPARPVAPARGHWRAPTPTPAGSSGGATTGKGVAGAGDALKGGGGGKGEELAVLAVILAVTAVFAVVGLAASEGSRWDGYTQMRPEQPVHLKNAQGQELHVALGALTPQDAALATEATVYDDEGYGLRLLDRRPIDRVGGTFKVTVGSLMEPAPAVEPRGEWRGGLASTIQLGGFVNRRLGILAGLQLGGGTDSAGRTFQRHGLSVEAQGFPLLAGPLALGAFGHAGLALAGDSQVGLNSGPALGGGLLLELALSTRLAFAVRGDLTATNIDGWAGHGTITAGLSIY